MANSFMVADYLDFDSRNKFSLIAISSHVRALKSDFVLSWNRT